MTKLNPSEKITMVRQVYTPLNMLTKDGALAGIVLTDDTFAQFKIPLRDSAIPHEPAPKIVMDPGMEHTFVIDGLLVMRVTQLEG